MLFSTNCLVLCLIIIAIFRIIAYYIDNRAFYKKASSLPGPKTIPILGNVNFFFLRMGNILTAMNQLSNSYPALYRLWLGNSLIVNISDPELVKIVLHDRNALEKTKVYKVFESLVDKGLLTTSVPSWRAHRKIIMPAFQTRKLQQYIETINKNVAKFMNVLSCKENCDEFDITKIYKIHGLRSILETLMDNSLNMCDDEIAKFDELQMRSVKFLMKRISNVFLLSDWIFNFTQLSRDTRTSAASIKNVFKPIIQRRREFLKTIDEKDIRDENYNKTFLDTLIEQCDEQHSITDEELTNEAITIVFGSIDTSICTFSFLMLVLVTHPEVQTKIREELYRIFGDTDPNDYPANASDLIKMEYLSRVIKETLRYFPIISYISRTATKDINIKKYTIPKGANVFISIVQIHRNEEFWPEPKKFDPDRFLPDEILKQPSCNYLPFSMGPRSCVGFRFAEMTLKIVISSILRKFVLSCDKTIPLHKVKLDYRIFTHQREPIKIKVRKVNEND